jgi:hypothetical protein
MIFYIYIFPEIPKTIETIEMIVVLVLVRRRYVILGTLVTLLPKDSISFWFLVFLTSRLHRPARAVHVAMMKMVGLRALRFVSYRKTASNVIYGYYR